MVRLLHLALAASMVATTPALAESAAPARVATLVVVKTPPGISRNQIEGGFKQAVPTYQKVPGLIRKYFTVNATGFGGMYLWENRAAAEAWYSPAWAAQCKTRYGSACEVVWFDTPIQIDGAAAAK